MLNRPSPKRKTPTTMTKSQIEFAARNGLPLSGTAVARVARSGGTVTLRHVWPENCDARVWDGVKRAAMRLARETSQRVGNDAQVCVQHQDGSVIGYVSASDWL